MPKDAERTPSAVRHQTEALVRARVLVDQNSTFKTRHADCDRAQPQLAF